MKKTSEVINWSLHLLQTVNILPEAVVSNQSLHREERNIYISPSACAASVLSSCDYNWSVAIMTLLRVLDKILIRGCHVYESAVVVTQLRRANAANCFWIRIHQKHKCVSCFFVFFSLCVCVRVCAERRCRYRDQITIRPYNVLSAHVRQPCKGLCVGKINRVKRETVSSVLLFDGVPAAWLCHPLFPSSTCSHKGRCLQGRRG